MDTTYSHVRNMTRSVIEKSLEHHSKAETLLFKLWRAIVTSNMRPIERFIGIITLTAGLWMGWPIGNQYDSTTYLYSLLVHHLPPQAWTTVFLLVSIPAIVGCDREKAMIPALCVPYSARVYGAFFSLWVWAFLTIVFLLDHNNALAAIWTPVIAFHQLWVLLWLWTREDMSETLRHDYSRGHS